MDALTEMDENADLSAATVLDRMINPDLPKVERCRFIRLTRADGGGGAFSSKKTFFSREFLLIIINVHIITVQLT